MSNQMTKHASVRQQQRGIPPLIMEWLSSYGKSCHDHQGAEILYFDKHSRKTLAKEVGDAIVSRLSNFLDTYMVVSRDGEVITIGYRFKRVTEH